MFLVVIRLWFCSVSERGLEAVAQTGPTLLSVPDVWGKPIQPSDRIPQLHPAQQPIGVLHPAHQWGGTFPVAQRRLCLLKHIVHRMSLRSQVSSRDRGSAQLLGVSACHCVTTDPSVIREGVGSTSKVHGKQPETELFSFWRTSTTEYKRCVNQRLRWLCWRELFMRWFRHKLHKNGCGCSLTDRNIEIERALGMEEEG